MKKLKYLVAALLIGAVALTGCGKKETISPEDAIKKAQNTMKTVDNYKMDMSVDAAIKAQGMSLEINFSLNGTIDEKNGKAKMTITANALGMDINTEMYTDTKSEEGKSITYTKQEDGTWSKSVSERTEVNADVSDAMLEIINSGSNVKAVKADSKDVNTYEITIPAEKLASLMDMAGTNDVTSIDTSSLKGNVVLRVSIDKKTNNFTKLYMDMKDLLSSTMSENEDIKVEISKAEFTINFSDYNKAGDVTIPADVTENATEDEDDDYNFGDDDDSDSDNFYIPYDYSAIINDNFSVTIPDGFEAGFLNDENTLSYEYETDADKAFDKCTFELSAIEGYTSASDFGKDLAEGYSLAEGVSKIINGRDWKILTEEDFFGKTYYAITEKDKKVYILEYSIESDANQATCESYYEQILNSIKAK